MKLNFENYKEVNKECHDPYQQGNTLNCFWVVQKAVERYVSGETLSQQALDLLTELHILIPSEDERKTSLLNHKFSEHV